MLQVVRCTVRSATQPSCRAGESTRADTTRGSDDSAALFSTACGARNKLAPLTAAVMNGTDASVTALGDNLHDVCVEHASGNCMSHVVCGPGVYCVVHVERCVVQCSKLRIAQVLRVACCSVSWTARQSR